MGESHARQGYDLPSKPRRLNSPTSASAPHLYFSGIDQATAVGLAAVGARKAQLPENLRKFYPVAAAKLRTAATSAMMVSEW